MDSTQVIFLIISAAVLIGAVGVVLMRNLFWAALSLVLSFVGVAGYYILLEVEFLAMVQLLVYVGAISILIIFAVMLSRRVMSPDFKALNEQWLFGLVTAIGLFAVLAFILLKVNWPVLESALPPETITYLGAALVNPNLFLLVFEVSSVLLLVALVGAVIIAREK